MLELCKREIVVWERQLCKKEISGRGNCLEKGAMKGGDAGEIVI